MGIIYIQIEVIWSTYLLLEEKNRLLSNTEINTMLLETVVKHNCFGVFLVLHLAKVVASPPFSIQNATVYEILQQA